MNWILLGVSSAILFLNISCGEAFQKVELPSKEEPLAENGSGQTPLDLVIDFSAPGYNIRFKHRSGDSVLINALGVPSPASDLGFSPVLTFDVVSAHSKTPKEVRLVELSTKNSLEMVPCYEGGNPECSLQKASRSWFEVVSCNLNVGVSMFVVPPPGSYEVRVIYQDGTQNGSIVKFIDPCKSLLLTDVSDPVRTIASDDSSAMVSKFTPMYLYSGIILLILLVLMTGAIRFIASRRK